MSAAQRHAGEGGQYPVARHELSVQGRERNPRDCSRHTRDRSPIGTAREFAVPGYSITRRARVWLHGRAQFALKNADCLTKCM